MTQETEPSADREHPGWMTSLRPLSPSGAEHYRPPVSRDSVDSGNGSSIFRGLRVVLHRGMILFKGGIDFFSFASMSTHFLSSLTHASATKGLSAVVGGPALNIESHTTEPRTIGRRKQSGTLSPCHGPFQQTPESRNPGPS